MAPMASGGKNVPAALAGIEVKQQERRRRRGQPDEQDDRAAVRPQPIAEPAARKHGDGSHAGKYRAHPGGLARRVAEVVTQVNRCPDVERLANYRAAEREEANDEEGAAAQQRQEQFTHAPDARLAGGKQVERVGFGLGEAGLDARLAQQQPVRHEANAGD